MTVKKDKKAPEIPQQGPLQPEQLVNPYAGLNIPFQAPQMPVPQQPQQQPQAPVPQQPVQQGQPVMQFPGIGQDPRAALPKPPSDPVGPDAKKQSEETLTKAQAAIEITIELSRIRKVLIISLVAMLLAMGAATIDLYVGSVIVAGYLIYAAWTLFKVNGKYKYLRWNYGI